MHIGGKERPVCFSMNQIGEFTAMYGGPFAVFDQFLAEIASGQYNFIQFRDFVYTALKWGAKKESLPVDFDSEQVGDWIGEVEDEQMAKFNDCLAEVLVKTREELKKKNQHKQTIAQATEQVAM